MFTVRTAAVEDMATVYQIRDGGYGRRHGLCDSRDPWDEKNVGSTYFLITDEAYSASPIGTFRLVPDSELRFPIEVEGGGVTLPEDLIREATLEASRLALDPEYVTENHGGWEQALLRIAGEAVNWSLSHGYRNWVMKMIPGIYLFYVKAYVPFRLLGDHPVVIPEAREQLLPAMLDLEQAKSYLYHSDLGLYRFMLENENPPRILLADHEAVVLAQALRGDRRRVSSIRKAPP